MDVEQYRKHGKWLIDYIINYNTTLMKRDVAPNVQPGFLRPKLAGKIGYFSNWKIGFF
jgi:hypothetical protein